ncbi:uncharacterized protein LOC122014379 isoform X1 [Zingiber officinale]|uniref:uncharacterized protein LOC122014379 isoform X1 n=1 Tax=Zingiber officinale TaxID=94328 RepID=UPI001C4C4009|nr:uncharacterized protein LOC122014379 isoform X1 [Zingiber officinale]
MCLDFTAPLLCSSGVSESHLSSMGWRGSSKRVMALKVALLCCLSFCVFSLFNFAEGHSGVNSAPSEASSWRRHSNYKRLYEIATASQRGCDFATSLHSYTTTSDTLLLEVLSLRCRGLRVATVADCHLQIYSSFSFKYNYFN